MTLAEAGELARYPYGGMVSSVALMRRHTGLIR